MGRVTFSLLFTLIQNKTLVSKAYHKGYHAVVLPYSGRGRAGQSYRKLYSQNLAVRTGGGLGTHSAPTSPPPILQKRTLRPRDGEQLDQSPSSHYKHGANLMIESHFPRMTKQKEIRSLKF